MVLSNRNIMHAPNLKRLPSKIFEKGLGQDCKVDWSLHLSCAEMFWIPCVLSGGREEI